MDPTTGLPMAFGKQGQSSSVAGPSQSAGSSTGGERGESSGRGSRGVVGGGKRSRGRGGGRGGGEAGEQIRRPDDEGMVLNGGVKRPHPSSARPTLPSAPENPYSPQIQSYGYPTSSRSNPNGMELGPRGGGFPPGGFGDRGGPPPPNRGGYDGGRVRGLGRGRGGREDGGRGRGGGGGGRGGGHAPPERGFYKPSFAEDPWKELLEARERAAGNSRSISGQTAML